MHIINSPPSVNSKSTKSRERIPPISNLLDFKIHFPGFLSTYIYTNLFPNLVTLHILRVSIIPLWPPAVWIYHSETLVYKEPRIYGLGQTRTPQWSPQRALFISMPGWRSGIENPIIPTTAFEKRYLEFQHIKIPLEHCIQFPRMLYKKYNKHNRKRWTLTWSHYQLIVSVKAVL